MMQMRISEVKDYIVRRYMSPTARRVALLLLGPPGIGKSVSVYDAAEEIAQKLGRQFITMRLRWRAGRFVIASDGEREFFEVLNHPEDFFVLTDIRLSTVAPEDLIGIPRSHEGMSMYEPLAWAVLHSTVPGIIFADERR